MKKNKLSVFRRIILTAALLSLGWLILTLWVEKNGEAKFWHLPGEEAKKVLIVFDPDPIYNLDEQVCLSAGAGLSGKGIDVTILTVAATENARLDEFDAYVLCANTYNWYPDWSMTHFIKSGDFLEGKPVVAVVVGSGSTENSEVVLKQTIHENGGDLLLSRSLWLMRPNNDSNTKEKNTQVAKAIAANIGVELANHLLITK